MNEIIETLATSCLHSLWIGALIAGLLAMFLNVIPESRSRIRYAAAWLSLLSVLVLPVILTVNSNPIFDLNVHVSQWFQAAVAISWIVGCVVSFVRFALGWSSILTMRRNSELVDDATVCGVFQSVKNRMGIREGVSLHSSNMISGPILIGWISPMILIPTGWLNGVPTSHLAAVFAHELAHARRWDFVANLVQRSFEAVMFFNPAVWWISSVIRSEREHACDDAAARFVNGATPYSRALVWFESHRSSGNQNRLALAFGDGRINGRISRLLRVSNDHKRLSPVAAISGISILALTFVLVTVLISGTRLFAKSSQEIQAVQLPQILTQRGEVFPDPPMGPISDPRLFETEIKWQPAERPLFVSVPIIERNGQLYDIRKDEPVLYPEFPNRYVREERLNFLDGTLPFRDLDGDGFSVMEEYQAGTDPKDPGAHPAHVEKLKFKSRKSKGYKIKYSAKPDAIRFQLVREPTAKWPRRETFFVKMGETTPDEQLKLKKYIQKTEVVNGITRDVSLLKATFLPTGEELELIRGISKVAPIYYAELESTIPSAKTFYVKKGDEFVVPGDPEKWTLREVKEDSCTIFRKGDDGKDVVKTITKTK